MHSKRIESIENSEESQKVIISQDEYETFLNTKLREELKSDLISWAKRQAWIIVLIISAIGIFGVSFIIESTVRKEVENEVKEAKEAIKPARDAAIAAQLETQNARDALSSLKKQRKEVESALVFLQEKAEELRDSFAAFEADINNVRTWSKNMQDQIELIIEKSALLDNEEISKRQKNTSEFEANSKFSVLVFYRHRRKDDAIQITESLISSGYRSSRTPTNLSEAIKQYPSGSIWVIYTSKGEKLLEKIKTELDGLGLKDTLQINPNSVSLRNGDMQLLLF
jgi:septal ring factor EnvC (AmiA/AmiB activator)